MPEKRAAFVRPRQYSIVLLLLLAGAFLFLLRPSIRGHDGVLNYAYLRSLLIDGDVHFANDYGYYLDRQARWFNNEDLPRDPVTNMPINLYGVGSSILWSPWVAAAHAALRLARPEAADGFSRPYEWAVALGSCFYATVGLWLVYQMAAQWYGRRGAFWAVLVVWLASPLVFYMYLHPSMSHANSFFLAALLLYIYTRTWQRLPAAGSEAGCLCYGAWQRLPAAGSEATCLCYGALRWLGMGAVAGLLVATRFQDAALLGGLAAAELWRAREAKLRGDLAKFAKGRPIRYLLFAAAAAVAFSPQLMAWHILQGSAWSGPRAYMMQGAIRPLAPVHAMEVLFSSRHGLLYWHPLLALGLVGLFAGGRNRTLAMFGLVAFAAQWWAVSSWSIWWAGASFGHRMFISTLPWLGLGLAAAISQVGSHRWRWALPALAVLDILWNLGYIVQYGSGMIDRQKGVPLRELAYNNVWRVPRLLLGLEKAPPPQDR